MIWAGAFAPAHITFVKYMSLQVDRGYSPMMVPLNVDVFPAKRDATVEQTPEPETLTIVFVLVDGIL